MLFRSVVKELKEELTHNEQFLQLFTREARLAARLNHANVVHTVEADQEDGRYFLAMEFLDGQPFNEILRRAEQSPGVPLALRLQVICQSLAGLHYAHELSDYDGRALHVVHRDVSPANIFVTYDGQVKVLDFGIAKAGDAEGTRPGEFKGKIGYASPEQLRFQPADRRVDVFAAGVVLWEAIALRHLVRGKPSRKIFEARLSGTEPRIGQLMPEVDPRLAEICDRAMCSDPEQRYPSAEAFRLALQGYLTERALGADAVMIAELMRTKFADERSAMHRLIETQLQAEGDLDSMVHRRRSAALLYPDHSAPIGFAERPDAERPSLEGARTLPKSKVSMRVVLGVTVLALSAALAFRVHTGSDEVEPASRAARAAPAQAAPEPSAPTSLPNAADNPEPRRSSERPRENKSTAKGSARVAPPISARAPEGALRLGPKAVPKGTPSSPVAPRASAVRVPAAARASEQGPAVDAASPKLEIDLRGVQRPDRRALDLQNPFR